MPIVAVSGGFSVIHYGHIRLIKEASKHGDVIVILNSDEWLKRKYGSVVVPYYQREEVMFNRYRDWETDRKSTRLNSSHRSLSRMPSSA